jgi:dihydroneopterin aldolase
MEVERELGQVFSVDAALEFELTNGDLAPTADSVVKGTDVYDITKNIMMGTKFRSHTSLALAISKELFSHLKQVSAIEVTVGRRQLFISGDVKEILAVVASKREDFEQKS